MISSTDTLFDTGNSNSEVFTFFKSEILQEYAKCVEMTYDSLPNNDNGFHIVMSVVESLFKLDHSDSTVNTLLNKIKNQFQLDGIALYLAANNKDYKQIVNTVNVHDLGISRCE